MCIFLLYPNHKKKGSRCFDPSSGHVFISRHVIFDEFSFPFATIQSPGSTNGTSYDDMVFIPMVRTEEHVTPVTPPPAAPTMEVLSPLPSSFPTPVEISYATNATISTASSIAGDSITIPAIDLRNKQKFVCRTHEGLPVIYRRKVGLTSSPHDPYGMGHTRATMAITMESKAVRRSESRKITSIGVVLCNTGT
ncbi:hypothetical protein RND71_038447 [Anisodus tanguticus]|uniref:Retroviral polymerase SH3-like domain-containing protein n=1 Tax=Anisodus tanguticus TaxID=243964 RepID=A0AAE1R0F0_9SOLA|nr:hypothetical protein RND71_038447 [Anisodus tanguticus]